MEQRNSRSRAAPTLPCRLYVGDLSFEARAETLRSAFEQHGQVADAVIVQDRSTGKSRGFGFVTMFQKRVGEISARVEIALSSAICFAESARSSATNS